jgi:hypothetical protein
MIAADQHSLHSAMKQETYYYNTLIVVYGERICETIVEKVPYD